MTMDKSHISQSPQKLQASTFEPSPEFISRQKRLEDAINLRRPDRVPVAPVVVHFYPTRVKGISNKDAQYDVEKTLEVWKETIIKHNWDAAPPFGSIHPAKPLDILGVQQMQWPGGALPDDRPFQWVEKEYMRQDEYDELLADPNGFALKKLWPRIATTLAPISHVAKMELPLLLYLSNAYTLPSWLGETVSQPSMTEALEKVLVLAQEVRIPLKSATCPLQIGRLSGQIGHPIKRGRGVARGWP